MTMIDTDMSHRSYVRIEGVNAKPEVAIMRLIERFSVFSKFI